MVKRAWILALALVASCAPKEFKFQIQIVTAACDPKLDPFMGVQTLRVRVSGDGLAKPLEAISPINSSSREIKIPDIPAGTNRVVEVRAYDGDPKGGGKVVSIGRSQPFKVDDVIPDNFDGVPKTLTVFLRRVNAFTPPSTSSDPKTCQKMGAARAGHTATLLPNGKVFIAGGYNIKAGTPEQQSLDSTEFFDPQSGQFTAGPRMLYGNTPIPKAFHTATLLNTNQVLLWGGEEYVGTTNLVTTKAVELIFDADSSTYTNAPMAKGCTKYARTRHVAVSDENGKVLFAGGFYKQTASGPTLLQDKVEWFDPQTAACGVVDGVSLPRKDASGIAVLQGQYVAIAGGADTTQLRNELVFFKYSGSAFLQQAVTPQPRLTEGRRSAGIATLRNSEQILVVGGYSDIADPKPLASSEIVTTKTSGVGAGPSVGLRGDPCTIGLNDGTVLIIGGRTVDGVGAPTRSDATTVLVTADMSGGVSPRGGPDLAVPRYAHTCTLLPDGSVLVLGGINETAAVPPAPGTNEILSDAYIFTPSPSND
ncbi:MAG: hypothetical protein K1X89_18935 [Myxococcaceae bacterium]|nr:hypothetical protein [Myxococcaceae bacterium]